MIDACRQVQPDDDVLRAVLLSALFGVKERREIRSDRRGNDAEKRKRDEHPYEENPHHPAPVSLALPLLRREVEGEAPASRRNRSRAWKTPRRIWSA
jgi:hypothetical protein